MILALLLAAFTVTLTWTDNSDNEDGFGIQAAQTCTIDAQGNATSGLFNDIGKVGANVQTFADPNASDGECYRVFAFNAAGNSEFSNTVQIPVNQNVVSIKTDAIVTVSRRATDTSTIISILVNANTVIGPGGFEISYPPNMTLLVSRRASNTSSVMAILVNHSTVVLINGVQK